MTKDTNYQPNNGGSKKFLYTGPKGKEPSEEDQWNFTPRHITPPPGPAIDLENVWSIKRNVAINAAQKDRLTLNASKNFYSRHGGMKEEGQDGAKAGQGSDTDKTWTSSNRNRSYSFGVAETNVSKPEPHLGQRHVTDMNDF